MMHAVRAGVLALVVTLAAGMARAEDGPGREKVRQDRLRAKQSLQTLMRRRKGYEAALDQWRVYAAEAPTAPESVKAAAQLQQHILTAQAKIDAFEQYLAASETYLEELKRPRQTTRTVRILSDDFDGEALNDEHWSHVGVGSKGWTETPGQSVSVSGGTLTIVQDQPKNGGAVWSTPFMVPGDAKVRLTRRVRLSPQSSFRNSTAITTVDGRILAEFRTFHDYRDHEDGVYFAFGSDTFTAVPLNEWFEETFTLNARTGQATYSVPGRPTMTHTASALSGETVCRLVFDAYGWFTGHKVAVDSLTLDTLVPAQRPMTAAPACPVVAWNMLPPPTLPPQRTPEPEAKPEPKREPPVREKPEPKQKPSIREKPEPPATAVAITMPELIKDPPAGVPVLLPLHKITRQIEKNRAAAADFVARHFPAMAGRLVEEQVRRIGKQDFYCCVYQRVTTVRFMGREYAYQRVLMVSYDTRGERRVSFLPLLEPGLPDPYTPEARPEQKVALPELGKRPALIVRDPTWPIKGCMVLTNLKRLKDRHPVNFKAIHQYLKAYGPILDVAVEGIDESDWRAIDQLLEARFDPEKLDCLFIVGDHDVIPFGLYANPAAAWKDIGERDFDVLSDDFYADFDHDSRQTWDILLTRLPDDRGLFQDPNSVLYQDVPPDDRLAYSPFAVVGNGTWPSTQEAAGLNVGTPAFLCRSGPSTCLTFKPEFFHQKNVVLNLLGTAKGSAFLFGETAGSDKTPPLPVPALYVDQARAPGALVLDLSSYGAAPGRRGGPAATSDTSLALRFLKNGARAYVGSTRASWSDPLTVAHLTPLWLKLMKKHLDQRVCPQRAFMLAKQAYAKQLDTVRGDVREFHEKSLHQMVYLGLPPLRYVQATDAGRDNRRRMILPDGVYLGQTREDQRHGKGTFTWNDKSTYTGQWQQDKMTGRGAMTWADGGTYDGDWKDGRCHGRGKRTWPDDSTYTGEWLESAMHGEGTMTWPNGDTYEGRWLSNRPAAGWLQRVGHPKIWARQDATGRWLKMRPPSQPLRPAPRPKPTPAPKQAPEQKEAPVPTSPAPTQLVPRKPNSDARALLYFNNGRWNDLTPVFAKGKTIYCYTDNKGYATAELIFWLAFDKRQRFSIRGHSERGVGPGNSNNYGAAAKLWVKRFAPADLKKELARGGIPEAFGKRLNAPYLYRILIKARDRGHFATYLLTMSTSVKGAIGKARIDHVGEDLHRAQVGVIHE